jgi:hypothetical protein
MAALKVKTFYFTYRLIVSILLLFGKLGFIVVTLLLYTYFKLDVSHILFNLCRVFCICCSSFPVICSSANSNVLRIQHMLFLIWDFRFLRLSSVCIWNKFVDREHPCLAVLLIWISWDSLSLMHLFLLYRLYSLYQAQWVSSFL